MTHDERYLNLWIKGLPGHYQTSFDEKSGYQHVSLHSSSRTFLGLQWQGFYFVFCT